MQDFLKFLSVATVAGMVFLYGYRNSSAQSNSVQSGSNTPPATESVGEVGLALFPFNPLFMIEGDKFYFGFTKEVSMSFFPYGRVSGEYSFIFRETKVNHLRISYNYDIPVVSSDYAAVLLSLGGGYFTDFDKEGYFPQAKLELILPITDNVIAGPYFKLRYTIMTKEEESNIADASLGLSLTFGL